MKNVRHIILDLGGVLLNIDHLKTAEAFAGIGIENFADHCGPSSQTGLFDDFETGRIEKTAFIEGVRALAGPSGPGLTSSATGISDADIERAWNAMLLDLPLRRLQILQQLQLHFDLFLLSNTNELHEAAFNKTVRAQCGFNTLAVFFDKVYFSHRTGHRKPDEAAFLQVLEDNSLRPECTLFVDDSEQHIAAAGKLGLQTIWLKPGMTIEDDIFKAKKAP